MSFHDLYLQGFEAAIEKLAGDVYNMKDYEHKRKKIESKVGLPTPANKVIDLTDKFKAKQYRDNKQKELADLYRDIGKGKKSTAGNLLDEDAKRFANSFEKQRLNLRHGSPENAIKDLLQSRKAIKGLGFGLAAAIPAMSYFGLKSYQSRKRTKTAGVNPYLAAAAVGGASTGTGSYIGSHRNKKMEEGERLGRAFTGAIPGAMLGTVIFGSLLDHNQKAINVAKELAKKAR